MTGSCGNLLFTVWEGISDRYYSEAGEQRVRSGVLPRHRYAKDPNLNELGGPVKEPWEVTFALKMFFLGVKGPKLSACLCAKWMDQKVPSACSKGSRN